MRATRSAIWDAFASRLKCGVAYDLDQLYAVAEEAMELDAEDWESDGVTSTRWQRNVRNVLQYRKRSGDLEWPERGRYRLTAQGADKSQVSARLTRRDGIAPRDPNATVRSSKVTQTNSDAEQFDDDPGEQPYDPADIPPEREVVTTPLDPPVKSLLDDIRSKSLIVNPEFQRRDVWDRTRKSRLIESLLLNIPIPVIFLAEDRDGTRVVVDGQQRLRAVEQFEAGQYALGGLQVLSSLNKKRWVDLTPRQARIILNRALRCIVISASSDPDLRFEVFERLNTSGVSLNDQELRNSIYRGPFNRFLNELANDEVWLRLLGRKEPDNRLQHHEMILRFLSMLEGSRDYRPPLKKWLSDFMAGHRLDRGEELVKYRASFLRACQAVTVVFRDPGAMPFRRARSLTDGVVVWDNTLNRPIFELQMLGLAEEDLDVLAARGPEIVQAFARLSLNEEFADAVSRATADKSRARLRFMLWGQALDELGIRNTLVARAPSDVQSK